VAWATPSDQCRPKISLALKGQTNRGHHSHILHDDSGIAHTPLDLSRTPSAIERTHLFAETMQLTVGRAQSGSEAIQLAVWRIPVSISCRQLDSGRTHSVVPEESKSKCWTKKPEDACTTKNFGHTMPATTSKRDDVTLEASACWKRMDTVIARTPKWIENMSE
jgi:hypothetical protein